MRMWLAATAAVMMTMTGPAAAADGPLFLRMGDAVVFRLDGGKPVDIRPAKPDDAPAAGEISVSLTYSAGTSTMTVVNNTDTFFNYRAFITDRADGKGQATSVCTLMSNGRTAFESWPGQPLPGIRLSDFTPARDGEMGCR